MKLKSLLEWCEWIKTLHSKKIDLGLTRVAEVARRLNLLQPSCPVITVAGTNGKGSCVAGLEAIYLAAGYRVGAFTSPYLFRYNEEVRVQGVPVADALFCEAFEKISIAADEISLTQFEFGTLAALIIFQKAKLDIWLLEVGLGGRFDAVNIIAADVAIVTTIALDHTEWLGNTREAIAYEKAGIFRENKPAICGDFDPPKTLVEHAENIAAPLFCQTKEFRFEEKKSSWDWWCEGNVLKNLPLPHLALQNMSTVLMAIDLLKKELPVKRIAIENALENVILPGRIEVWPGEITHIYDVSHNPAAVTYLAKYLRNTSCYGNTYAVFSMLMDKDITSTIAVIHELIDHWYVAPLAVERGASREILTASFRELNSRTISMYQTIIDAYEHIMQIAKKGDRVIVFGSFHTVAEVMRNLNKSKC